MILPKGGNGVPGAVAVRRGGYAELFAAALRAEFGDRRHTVKVIMRWTRASGRTVRYWLAAQATPNGSHLIEMIARSDHVLETVLAASRRVELLDAFIRMRAGAAAKASSPSAASPARRYRGRGPDGPDGTDGPGGNNGTGGLDHPKARAGVGDAALNERQLWFVERLGQDPRLDADALALRFDVSERTAKRDIAGLKAA